MASFETARQGAVARRSARRFFTLQQANQALPLVERVVRDIVSQHHHLEALQRRRKKLLRQGRIEEVARLDVQASPGVQRLNDLINEVSEIGCVLKDWERGAVDFPAIAEGRRIMYCWRLGERSVQHWHEWYAGDAARQPAV